jgi:predicted 2-oxoglutarate/Fe(II)-dependent dioxygenase YbiX
MPNTQASLLYLSKTELPPHMNNHVLDKMFLPHPDAENRQKSEGEERRLSSPISVNSFFEQSQHCKTHWNSAEQYTAQLFSKRMIIRFWQENV